MLKPIARGINCLESQRFFAYYLITLFNIRNELKGLSDENLRYAKPLLKVVTEGFELRFKDIININSPNSVPLYLSMLTHPGFKIHFIPEMKKPTSALEYITKCKGMLLKAIESIDLEEELSNKNVSPAETNTNNHELANDAENPHDGGLYFFQHFLRKVQLHIQFFFTLKSYYLFLNIFKL